jgi:hypothetical protein
MKKFGLVWLLLFSLTAFADDVPTYKSDPEQEGKYSTGYVRPPLNAEQEKAQREFAQAAVREGWTFNTDVTQIGKYSTGYKKGPGLLGDFQGSFHLSGAPSALAPITFRGLSGMPKIVNQGQCGSCVVAAFTGGFMWDMALRLVTFPDPLSMQHLMNCGGSAGQCGGDYGERVGGRLEKLGCLVSNTDYPYTARNARCSDTNGMKCYGQAGKVRTIDGSFGSILFALHETQTVKVGVAADARFMSYKSGVYNGFGSMGTNHYVLVVGAYCSKQAQNAASECELDADGDLKAGNQYGFLIIANSWGTDYGDDGFITMQFENASGRRNNNIAGGQGNAQVMDSPIPVPPNGPVEFKMTGPSSFTVIVKPGTYLAETLKAALISAGYTEVK